MSASESEEARKQREARKAEDEFWEKKRDSFLDGINERIRTMVIGALVVIWGLFNGNEHGAVRVGPGTSRALLGIAAASVLVLIFDSLEYVMGYQLARQRISRVKLRWWKRFDYRGWKDRFFIAKQVLGYTTLLSLVILLGFMLIVSPGAQAQTAAADLKGRWCGKDPSDSNYMILDVTHDNGAFQMSLSDVQCDNVVLKDGALSADCCERHIDDARRDQNDPNVLKVKWEYYTTGYIGENDLVDCAH